MGLDVVDGSKDWDTHQPLRAFTLLSSSRPAKPRMKAITSDISFMAGGVREERVYKSATRRAQAPGAFHFSWRI